MSNRMNKYQRASAKMATRICARTLRHVDVHQNATHANINTLVIIDKCANTQFAVHVRYTKQRNPVNIDIGENAIDDNAMLNVDIKTHDVNECIDDVVNIIDSIINKRPIVSFQ